MWRTTNRAHPEEPESGPPPCSHGLRVSSAPERTTVSESQRREAEELQKNGAYLRATLRNSAQKFLKRKMKFLIKCDPFFLLLLLVLLLEKNRSRATEKHGIMILSITWSKGRCSGEPPPRQEARPASAAPGKTRSNSSLPWRRRRRTPSWW